MRPAVIVARIAGASRHSRLETEPIWTAEEVRILCVKQLQSECSPEMHAATEEREINSLYTSPVDSAEKTQFLGGFCLKISSVKFVSSAITLQCKSVQVRWSLT